MWALQALDSIKKATSVLPKDDVKKLEKEVGNMAKNVQKLSA